MEKGSDAVMIVVGLGLAALCLAVGNRAGVGREMRWTRAGIAVFVFGVLVEVLR
ncbi:MAG: hypothetical protein L6Q98_25280 [Anaerolineae bacterium]|nr:hypothetical protein [Anaerolineae bacterium]